MSETLLILILSASMGIYHDANKPTKYVLSMEDGSQSHVILQKNSQYACPLHCGVDHIHHAIICNEDYEIEESKTVYHISKIDNDLAFYCSFSLQKILSMNKMTPRTKRDELPDVMSASNEK